jgi:hypothetical protein
MIEYEIINDELVVCCDHNWLVYNKVVQGNYGRFSHLHTYIDKKLKCSKCNKEIENERK